MKKISIITPCFNAEKYIEKTIESVIYQTAVRSGNVELEYIICDGNSTDNTVEVVKRTVQAVIPDIAVKIISEPDAGMYDALAKGLQLASGDVVAYINAGDFYHLSAFEVVKDIFQLEGVRWITGYTVCYNEDSQIIEINFPYKYRRKLFECGYYGNGLPVVQQESTFWHADLIKTIDFDKLSKFKYAGDFYLWLQFSKACELKIVRSYLGGFKYHEGQLSQTAVNNVSLYQSELKTLTESRSIIERTIAGLDRLCWSAPFKIKKMLCKDTYITYNLKKQCWKLV